MRRTSARLAQKALRDKVDNIRASKAKRPVRNTIAISDVRIRDKKPQQTQTTALSDERTRDKKAQQSQTTKNNVASLSALEISNIVSQWASKQVTPNEGDNRHSWWWSPTIRNEIRKYFPNVVADLIMLYLPLTLVEHSFGVDSGICLHGVLDTEPEMVFSVDDSSSDESSTCLISYDRMIDDETVQKSATLVDLDMAQVERHISCPPGSVFSDVSDLLVCAGKFLFWSPHTAEAWRVTNVVTCLDSKFFHCSNVTATTLGLLGLGHTLGRWFEEGVVHYHHRNYRHNFRIVLLPIRKMTRSTTHYVEHELDAGVAFEDSQVGSDRLDCFALAPELNRVYFTYASARSIFWIRFPEKLCFSENTKNTNTALTVHAFPLHEEDANEEIVSMGFSQHPLQKHVLYIVFTTKIVAYHIPSERRLRDYATKVCNLPPRDDWWLKIAGKRVNKLPFAWIRRKGESRYFLASVRNPLSLSYCWSVSDPV